MSQKTLTNIQNKNNTADLEKNKFTDFTSLNNMSNTISNFGFKKELNEENLLNTNNFIKIHNTNGIMVNTKYGTSLRIAMEKLDLIPEYEEKKIDGVEKIINNTNLFLKKKKITEEDLNNGNKLEDINKFNNSILKNTNWGLNDANKPYSPEDNIRNTQFFKPDKKEIEREIGKNVYNTKLPRARLLTKIKDPGSNSFNIIANKTAGVSRKKFFNASLYDSGFNKTAFDSKGGFKKNKE